MHTVPKPASKNDGEPQRFQWPTVALTKQCVCQYIVMMNQQTTVPPSFQKFLADFHFLILSNLPVNHVAWRSKIPHEQCYHSQKDNHHALDVGTELSYFLQIWRRQVFPLHCLKCRLSKTEANCKASVLLLQVSH